MSASLQSQPIDRSEEPDESEDRVFVDLSDAAWCIGESIFEEFLDTPELP